MSGVKKQSQVIIVTTTTIIIIVTIATVAPESFCPLLACPLGRGWGQHAEGWGGLTDGEEAWLSMGRKARQPLGGRMCRGRDWFPVTATSLSACALINLKALFGGGDAGPCPELSLRCHHRVGGGWGHCSRASGRGSKHKAAHPAECLMVCRGWSPDVGRQGLRADAGSVAAA